MRTGSPGGEPVRMAHPDDARIVVEIDASEDPITGTVTDGAGGRSAFVGYAHLVAEIERRRPSAEDIGQSKHCGASPMRTA
jgi:hypothetical protein